MRTKTHDRWFGQEWRSAQRELATPENYDLDAVAFARRLFGDISQLPRAASFPMSKVGELGDILEGREKGHFYARAGTPQEDNLRERLVQTEAGYSADAEDLVGAAVFPTGMAAIYATAMALVRRILKRRRGNALFLRGETIFSGTKTVLDEILPKETTIKPAIPVDTTNLRQVDAMLNEYGPNVIAIVYETITNPLNEFTNTRRVAELAHSHSVPVVVDNTFLTPYLQQPLRMGADVVIHSLTKYMNGCGDLLGGAVIGPSALVTNLRKWQTSTGVVMDQGVAEMVYNRLAELSERMEMHVTYARQVAKFLEGSIRVSAVYYPDLGNQTRSGAAGAVVTFKLIGRNNDRTMERERRFVQHVIDHGVGILSYEVSLGAEKHLVIGETTLGPPLNFPAGTVRLSVGREPVAGNLIELLHAALEVAYR